MTGMDTMAGDLTTAGDLAIGSRPATWRPTTWRPRIGNRRSDRGVALIEAAIILPFLLLLAVGVFEAGFAWRDDNVLARATQSAARIDARGANARSADYEALRALQTGLSPLTASSVKSVIVYDAAGTGNVAPAGCRTIADNRADDTAPAGVDGVCNVYSATQLGSAALTAFDSDDCTDASDWDHFWCPSSRNRSGDVPDRVGVWVELDYGMVSKVLPTDLHLTHGAVFQLEPCNAGETTCS